MRSRVPHSISGTPIIFRRQPVHQTLTARALLCESKINWELSERATLLAEQVTERMAVKNGARRFATIVMAVKSSDLGGPV